jgi:hypothetical protein
MDTVLFQAELRDISQFQSVQTAPGGHSFSYPMDIGGNSSGFKEAGALNRPVTSNY